MCWACAQRRGCLIAMPHRPICTPSKAPTFASRAHHTHPLAHTIPPRASATRIQHGCTNAAHAVPHRSLRQRVWPPSAEALEQQVLLLDSEMRGPCAVMSLRELLNASAASCAAEPACRTKVGLGAG
eukprot:7026116-Prymnesium_polylepis.1